MTERTEATPGTCEVCGKSTRGDYGRCTNGRCGECHRLYCGPGGETSPGHARRWPELGNDGTQDAIEATQMESAPTVAPGTPCQCAADSIEPRHRHIRNGGTIGCWRDAVRMVTVRPGMNKVEFRERIAELMRQTAHSRNPLRRIEAEQQARWEDERLSRDLAMCEPCAAFHEAKERAR